MSCYLGFPLTAFLSYNRPDLFGLDKNQIRQVCESNDVLSLTICARVDVYIIHIENLHLQDIRDRMFLNRDSEAVRYEKQLQFRAQIRGLQEKQMNEDKHERRKEKIAAPIEPPKAPIDKHEYAQFLNKTEIAKYENQLALANKPDIE